MGSGFPRGEIRNAGEDPGFLRFNYLSNARTPALRASLLVEILWYPKHNNTSVKFRNLRALEIVREYLVVTVSAVGHHCCPDLTQADAVSPSRADQPESRGIV